MAPYDMGHISAEFDQIRKINVSMEAEEHAQQRIQNDPSTQASVHSRYNLVCSDPYLGHFMSDFKDKGMYGILRLFPTCLDIF